MQQSNKSLNEYVNEFKKFQKIQKKLENLHT